MIAYLNLYVCPVDEPNVNGIIYPRDVIERMLGSLGDDTVTGKIGDGSGFGYNIADCTHVVQKLYINDEGVEGQPKGLYALVKPVGPNLEVFEQLAQSTPLRCWPGFLGTVDGNRVTELAISRIDVGPL